VYKGKTILPSQVPTLSSRLRFMQQLASKKCDITIQNIHQLWKTKCYCGKGGLIWKGENDLSPSSEIV